MLDNAPAHSTQQGMLHSKVSDSYLLSVLERSGRHLEDAALHLLRPAKDGEGDAWADAPRREDRGDLLAEHGVGPGPTQVLVQQRAEGRQPAHLLQLCLYSKTGR